MAVRSHRQLIIEIFRQSVNIIEAYIVESMTWNER